MFALIDCNNFFVSCERLFRPELDERPVVVLSSNDGCVVSRSSEAKVLGIPMGAPAFQWRDFFIHNGVTAFSANFELYGNVSRRVIRILSGAAPHTEIYSIDESFLDLSSLDIINYRAWGSALRQQILHEVGVPVSIGIAPTKTLAKLGAGYAKKHPECTGVLSLATALPGQRLAYLARFPVEEVWGVGHRLAPKLRAEGLTTALALSQLRPRRARQLMGLAGLQTVYELQGTSCLAIDTLHTLHKTIMRSRTFGEDTYDLADLQSVITTLTVGASQELRTEQQLTTKALLFLSTSRHKPGYRTWYEEIILPMPTSDSGHIIKALSKRLDAIYDSHQAYHRAGVTLYELSSAEYLQIDLTGQVSPTLHKQSQARMRAIDSLNTRFGRGTIYYAAEHLSTTWQPKHNARSPAYVTSWHELPEAHFVAKII